MELVAVSVHVCVCVGVRPWTEDECSCFEEGNNNNLLHVKAWEISKS